MRAVLCNGAVQYSTWWYCIYNYSDEMVAIRRPNGAWQTAYPLPRKSWEHWVTHTSGIVEIDEDEIIDLGL